MDVGVAFFLAAVWCMLLTALVGAIFVTWLALKGFWRFIVFVCTVSYRQRRR